MKRYSDGAAIAPPLTAAAMALSSDDRWGQWEAKGARHDALVARNVRLIAVITVTACLIWAALFRP